MGSSYLPRQTGARFSAKARAPSRASSDVEMGSAASRWRAHFSSAGQPSDSATIRLLIVTASGRGTALRHARETATARVGPLAAHERLEVHARAERAVRAGQDPDPQVRILVEAVHRLRDELGEPDVHGVARLGAVEGDEQDAIGRGADVDRLPLHRDLAHARPRSENGRCRSGSGSLGSPSTRSAMMLRWISDVPPAIE